MMVSAVIGMLWGMFCGPALLMLFGRPVTRYSWSLAALALWLGWMVPEVVRWWRA